MQVRDRYCQNSSSENVTLNIIRDQANNPLIEGTSGVGTPLKGFFFVYAKATESDNYPEDPNDGFLSDTHNLLNPSDFYTDYANDADSVLIRLEYLSHPDEDVGEQSSCRGRGSVEFTIYRIPDSPEFDYSSSFLTNAKVF